MIRKAHQPLFFCARIMSYAFQANAQSTFNNPPIIGMKGLFKAVKVIKKSGFTLTQLQSTE
jgi:phosphoserine aminotransferase